jgi:transcriptional regulator with XRE-family HTH domain
MGILPARQLVRVPAWTLGDRLRKARATAGLTRPQLAAGVGVSVRAIAAAETDERAPGQLELGRWAQVTGVPVGWLGGDLIRAGWTVAA